MSTFYFLRCLLLRLSQKKTSESVVKKRRVNRKRVVYRFEFQTWIARIFFSLFFVKFLLRVWFFSIRSVVKRCESYILCLPLPLTKQTFGFGDVKHQLSTSLYFVLEQKCHLNFFPGIFQTTNLMNNVWEPENGNQQINKQTFDYYS